MYKKYNKLTKTELEQVLQLGDEITFKRAAGSSRRVGLNGIKALSVYNYSKWFEWTNKQRELYKTFFPAEVLPKVIQGWFLEIPPNSGFLDKMDYWIGKPLSGRVIATALRAQTIIIGDEAVRLKAGEQIGFSLETMHEITKSTEGQLWACVMFRGCYTEIDG